ncbi:aminoglycoside phosphotransferase family protein [Phenylobacterium sp.]|uniref:phosphotransferase family protein n=1 Tax=Phenylobacterium sp. TaxID=1871053 RepID=UPI002BA441D1|nr:aminoglycoside phosphotransferase family protein [Phenylobacterium sp.]HVI33885.1 aminoglycoside phosphotransferase family protein [Phenylobacterium sp.]
MGAAEEITAWLREAGLAGPAEAPAVTPLAGGVSSDVFRVDLARGPVCVKRALAQLKVAADWRAPVERSANEAAWLRAVRPLRGPIVPEVLAEDTRRHLFAMTWFEPASHPVWKAELTAGRVDSAFAAAVGRALARVHAGTADAPDLARAFATDAMFVSLRIEPYLTHTAAAHPALGSRLGAIAETTLATRRALVHGDVSPKNILGGPDGPVFLDAECAWYGDPAFDIAFCANHLLLKAVWQPQHAAAYAAAFDALVRAYLKGVAWEPAEALEARAAPLLAALLLARIDGKSPVEYLTTEAAKARVRDAASALLARPALRFADAAGEIHDRLGAP